MMKKNGFTLAEVLITLAIIGVIATMTLPGLMTNTAEQQAKTGLRKGINTLTESAQMSEAMAGFNYASLTDPDTTDVERQSLYGLLAKRAAVDLGKSGVNKHMSNGAASANYAMYFRDGSVLMFNPSDTTEKKVGQILGDGLPAGFPAIYDTNGVKGPNLVSNCTGKTTGLTGSDKAGNCSDTKKRVIKDQFGVKLRGNFVTPNGAAARWAYEN